MLTIVAAVFVFFILVLVHELGHFATAKLTGMQVDEFAIGFGPKLWSTKRGETEYSVRAVPLGGFNDIAGMDPEENDAGKRGYCEKSIPARLLVISAGSLMNFILPVFLFFGIFYFSGVQNTSTAPVIGQVVSGKAADAAGLAAGDKIISIDGNNVLVWQDIVDNLKDKDSSLNIVYERDGVQNETAVTPYYDKQLKRSLVGIVASTTTEYPGLFEAAGLAVKRTVAIIGAMIGELARLIGEPSDAELAGPIGVAQMAGQFAERGFVPLLSFAAFLSLNLGIINLLPVPALDGGHVVALLVEAVRGKPMSRNMMRYTQGFGIALLVLLMLFATKNDIVRVFTGS